MNKRRLAYATLLALSAFLLSWEQVEATRVGYRVGKARSDLASRRDSVAYLRRDLERLRAPERLAREAVSRLRMAPPSPDVQIVLGETAASPRRSGRRPGYLSFLVGEPH